MQTFILRLSRITLLALLTICLISFSGCAGYHVGDIKGQQVQGIKRIYVPTVKNNTYTPDIEMEVTNSILRKIDNDGTYESSRSKQADGILEVTIIEVQKVPTMRSSMNLQLVQQYQINLKVKATFTNLITGQRIFTDRQVQGSTLMLVQNDPVEGVRQAIPSAADDMSANLVSLIADGW